MALLCYLLLIFVIGFARLRIGVRWPTEVVAGGIQARTPDKQP